MIDTRTYEEICEDLRTAIPGKECRKLHKELKAYGDGLRFTDRYPYFLAYLSFGLSAIALVLAIASIVKSLSML